MKRREFIERAGRIAGTAILTDPFPNEGREESSSTAGQKPNILFIMTDQQSADAMSCRMGNQYIRTPAMDELASRGISFTRAYTANPLCVPARTALFTGQPPHRTGFQTNDLKRPLDAQFRCLGTYFRDAGYDTGYIGKWHLPFPAKEKSSHGFDFMEAIRNNGVDMDIPAPAGDFLKGKRDKPFFLVTSFVNPHNICEWARGEELKDAAIGNPPPADQCPPAVSNLAPMEKETDTMLLMRRSIQSSPMFPVGQFDEKKWRQYRWAYFRMIEKVDAHIGSLLRALRESNQLDRTVIVLTSDHGDCQGAHGWNQKTVFYDNASRVPLVLAGPGIKPGTVSDRLINTALDLLPTFADFAAIRLPVSLPGISLKKACKQPKVEDPRQYVVVENKMIQGAPIDGVKPEPEGRMVRSRRFQYCTYNLGKRHESLVDMQRDPGETVNLVENPEYRKELDRHRRFLADWCQTTGDSFLKTISA
jgi:arylsulfatase A-like enzyme